MECGPRGGTLAHSSSHEYCRLHRTEESKWEDWGGSTIVPAVWCTTKRETCRMMGWFDIIHITWIPYILHIYVCIYIQICVYIYIFMYLYIYIYINCELGNGLPTSNSLFPSRLAWSFLAPPARTSHVRWAAEPQLIDMEKGWTTAYCYAVPLQPAKSLWREDTPTLHCTEGHTEPSVCRHMHCWPSWKDLAGWKVCSTWDWGPELIRMCTFHNKYRYI